MYIFIFLQVSITIDPPQARPNDHVTIKIQTEGQALVGLDGIDKSILYLADVKSISEARVSSCLFRLMTNLTDSSMSDSTSLTGVNRLSNCIEGCMQMAGKKVFGYDKNNAG